MSKAVYAPLFAEHTHTSPATLVRGLFNRFLLESELAVTFRTALPPRAEAYSRQEVQAAAGCIHAAFEVVDTRFQAWPNVHPLWLLADGLSHGCFILGKGVKLNDPRMLVQAHYKLVIDGNILQDVHRAHPQPDPWYTLTQLVNLLSAGDSGVGEGDVVTTGSYSGVTPLEPGQEAEVSFSGIGNCRVRLEA